MPLRQQPIAVIGFAFRFPNGLECLDSLRHALSHRLSAIDRVPLTRWSVERYYSSNPLSKGKAYIQRGGFLRQDISQFDANFFGISPRDAENMDPQQRLLLEVVWEAFENAGLSLPAHAGRNVGVYVGGFMLDHMISQMAPSNRSQINQHTAAGMMMTMLSNRISHTFDLRGPSLSIDTACSSSLVAFHYACQDIWHNAAEVAIVGGANVMTRPEYPMGMCKGHFLARDGECKSFDARGDGYGRGEGAAAVLLKPLARALADGDPILATVIGSGTNQDGRTPGISMPSRSAQQSLIEQVCRDYDINPRDVQYVECHGTGTAVGDPTETAAIGAVYGQARSGLSPVIVGSIKSNIGHTEAVAGVAGVIKAVLTTMDRQAYPLGNLQTPHPDIPFAEWNLRLSDDLIPLGDSFCAAINSFGYGGSNAHIVLQTAPVSDVNPPLTTSSPSSTENAPLLSGSERRQRNTANSFPSMLPISARSPSALAEVAGRYACLLEQPNVSLKDVLFTASHKRAHLSHRAVIKGNSAAELVAGLRALSTAQESSDVVTNTVPYSGHTAPVFVFTGMGPQWWSMGQELYRDQPVYREAVDQADELFQSIAGWSILAEMLKSETESRITQTEYAQPANLIVQIGLLAVLRAAGIQPGAVVGHSVGELASAYAAGVLGLHDCLTVSYHRSQLQARCRGTGGMWAVAVSQSRAASLIESMSETVAIAAINGPTNITLAGDPDRLADIAEQLSREGIFNRKLEVEVPYHSPMMRPIMEPLRQALAQLAPQLPGIPLYSTVTGSRVAGIAYDAEYWTRNVRQSVEFAAAIQALLDDGYTNFIEVGPHPVLATSLADCIRQAGKECRALHTLRRNTPEVTAIHRAIMNVHASGSHIDWHVLNGQGRMIAVPNYAWQREKYWLENDRAAQDRIAPVDYPLLGIQEAPGAPHYRNDFDHEPMMYLRDHVVTGMPVLPAAAYIEALLELATIHFEEAAAWSLRDLSIQSPLLLNPDRGTDFVTDFDPVTQHAVIRSLENGRLGFGQDHVSCRVTAANGQASSQAAVAPEPDNETTTDQPELNVWRQQLPQLSSIAELYSSLAAIGLTYGPAFQTVREIRVDQAAGKLLARIELQSELASDLHKYCLHPTLLDACFHSLMTMLQGADSTYLPTGLQELTLFQRPSPTALYCYAERVYQDARHIDCNLTLVSETGELIALVRGMRLTAASKRERTDKHGDRVREQILTYEWMYSQSSGEPKRLGHWLVVGGIDPIAEQVAQQLEHYGTVVAACLSIGAEYQQAGNRHTVRSGNAADIDRVLAECGELDGIVFVHGLDQVAADTRKLVDSQDSDPTGQLAITHLMALAQACHRRQFTSTPRAYVVTQCALAVKDFDRQVVPGQTAINGFVRVAFNELEGYQFTSIDLPARITDEIVDMLTIELLSDAEHDEVAFRGSLRYVSELIESRVLSQDRVEQQRLDDQHPVQVRALRPDSDSPGTGRLIALEFSPIESQQIRLRIESMVIPRDLLLDPTADGIDQPLVEIVARVLELGTSVSDLQVGQRVAGFAPADLCSHMVGDRSQFTLAPISDDLPADKIVAQLGYMTRAQLALESISPQAGETALVQLDEFGLVLARLLSSAGVQVCGLAIESQVPMSQFTMSQVDYPVVQANSQDMQRAVQKFTQGRGFTILAVQLGRWLDRNGLWMLTQGGTLLDLQSDSSPFEAAQHIGVMIRTDLRTHCRRPHLMQRALGRAIVEITQCEHAQGRALDVSIADIAWRKLPLGGNAATLTLSFDSGSAQLPVVQPTQLRMNPAGTYLVTGGLGGFGQKTASWLVDQGARSLVLTSRQGADTPQRVAFVEELRARGVAVHAIACDGAELDQVQRLLHRIDSEMLPMVGVYHSAAVIIDQLILEMDQPTFAQVMRNKALAAWHLHNLTKDRALEQFVLYSSVANLVGNARQAAYSAANGFLNGLAYHRRSLGLAATSVNWGVIGDVGVVSQDEKLEQYLRYTGMRGIESRDALAVLGQALARDVTQFGLTLISSWADWARFETRGSKSPRFATLIASDTQGNNSSVREAILSELVTLTADEQLEVLSGLILEVIAGVLKADPSSIALDRKIEQLGVDSLMATEIQMLLGSQLGLSVSVLELIGDATIRSLTVQSLKTLLSEGSVDQKSLALTS